MTLMNIRQINRSESINIHLVLPPSILPQPSGSSTSSASAAPAITARLAGQTSVSGRRDHDSQDTATRNTVVSNEHLSPQFPLSSHPPFDSLTSASRDVPRPLPTHMQQALTQHFQMLFQHFAPQSLFDGNTNVPGTTSNPSNNNQIQRSPDQAQPENSHSSQDPLMQQPVFQPLSFNRIIARQQQIRAAAGFHGLGASHLQQHAQSDISPVPGSSAPRDIAANSESSECKRIEAQSNSRTSDDSTQKTLKSPPESTAHPPTSQVHPDRSPEGDPRSERSQESLIEEHLTAVEAALATSSALHGLLFQSLRDQFHILQTQTDTSPETLTRLGTRLEDLSTRADQLRTTLDSALPRISAENIPVQTSSTSTLPAISNNADNAVYLLSSPSGPHALLVSPSGLYTAPWQNPLPSDPSSNPNANQNLDWYLDLINSSQTGRSIHESNDQTSHTNLGQNVRPRQVTEPSPQAQSPFEQQQPQQQPHLQPEQQGQINQVRDLARLLLPMGGHLWLLIRLFGFVYFFTGGGGNLRTIILALCALVVFVAQTGALRPFLQSIWEPLRRHVENILPLAATDRPLAGQAQEVNPGNNPNAIEGQRAPGVPAVPTPRQGAERLLREQERRDGGVLRQNLRRLERAVALFLASLVPGVGERHIAARDAAEVARRDEERTRAENARREEEQRLENEGREQERRDQAESREPQVAHRRRESC